MKCVDTRGNWDEIFSDESRKLSPDVLENLCKMSQGEGTCRYIIFGSRGFICAKGSEFQKIIDEREDNNKMVARGDNCEGIKNNK